MSRGIELTRSQIEAYESGATMFMFMSIHKIVNVTKDRLEFEAEEWTHSQPLDDYIEQFAPIQKGDEDIFVKEEFLICEHENYHDHATKSTYIAYDTKSTDHFSMEWHPASQMTKEQSRYSFSECIDVRVVKVQNINDLLIMNKCRCLVMSYELKAEYKKDFIDLYNQQTQELGINRTYVDNDYVFLVEFKR